MSQDDLMKKYNALLKQNAEYEKMSRLIADNLQKFEQAAREKEQAIEALKRENKAKQDQIEALEIERAEIYAEIAKYKVMANEFARLKKEYKELVDKVRSQGVVGFRKELIDNLAAKILVRSIQGYDVNEVVDYIKTVCKKEIPPAKVYRTISVKEDNDLARMLAIYQENVDEFGSLKEEDIKKWFILKRIKKLRLMDEMTLRFEYGAEIVNSVLPTIEQDKIVTGYYSTEMFENYKKTHSRPEKAKDFFEALEMTEI